MRKGRSMESFPVARGLIRAWRGTIAKSSRARTRRNAQLPVQRPLVRRLPFRATMTTGLGEQHAAPHSPAPSEELLNLRLAVEASGEVIFMTDRREGTITS